jgi:hypothetical protein
MHLDRWSTQIAERIQTVSPGRRLVFRVRGLNRWCHIWAYKDAAERFAVREV